MKALSIGLCLMLAPISRADVSSALAKPDPCPQSEVEIQSLAAKIPSQPALSDYRLCNDPKTCVLKDCARSTPNVSVCYSTKRPCKTPTPEFVKAETEFKAASRPFIMCRNPSVPFKGTITLVHGLNDSPFTLLGLAAKLREEGYNVVAPLLSGHGADAINDIHAEPKSIMSKERWNRDVENAVALTGKIFGTKNLYLGGYSTGGELALDYAKMHESQPGYPIQGIVALDPGAALPPTKVGLGIEAPTVEGALRQGLTNTVFNEVARYILGKDNPLGVDTASRTPNYHPMEAAAALSSVIEDVRSAKQIRTPTLAIFSSGASETSGKDTVDAVNGAKLLCGEERKRSGNTPSGGLLASTLSQCPKNCPGEKVGYGNLRHVQIPLSREYMFAGCEPPKQTQPVGHEGYDNEKFNPMFNCMAKQIAGFLATTGDGDRGRDALPPKVGSETEK